jgi:hypothetical protein
MANVPYGIVGNKEQLMYKKRFLFLSFAVFLLAAIFAFTMIGCDTDGSGSKGSSSSSSEEGTKKYDITFFNVSSTNVTVNCPYLDSNFTINKNSTKKTKSTVSKPTFTYTPTTVKVTTDFSDEKQLEVYFSD